MPKDLPTLLDVAQIAEKLSVSKSSVLRLMGTGQIRSLKIGGKRFAAVHDVWVYLQQARRQSEQEVQLRMQEKAARAQLAANASGGATPSLFDPLDVGQPAE